MPEIDSPESADRDAELERYQATLFHVELIRDRIAKLLQVQVEAERQVLHRAGRDYAAGELSIDGLLELYHRYRETACPVRADGKRRYVERPGFSDLWNEAIEVHSSKVANAAKTAWQLKRYEPNDGAGWSGELPLRPKDHRPRTGQSVVYILFDDANVPCYVGSTNGFKGRFYAHLRDKAFRRWVAYPCADREAAYDLEVRLLREHKPYLNKKVGR
jgi:predicted GIY-YIG superfamily endonuclease